MPPTPLLRVLRPLAAVHALGGRVRLGTALVAGPSMEPVLQDGDCLLVAWGAATRPGDVVVARPHERPELLVVKRAVAPLGVAWEVASDNPAVRGLGWTGGPADVLGRVLLRWWPLPPRLVR